MTSKVSKINQNIKNYTTNTGTYYVHGVLFEGDSVQYEYHAKTQECKKVRVGENITYTLTKDKQGNPKIKLEQAAFGSGGQQGAPVANPYPSDSLNVPALGTSATWLTVFKSICIFQSGSGKSLDDIIKATNMVIEKHVPK